MTASVLRHPNRPHHSMRAGLAALMRWYPGTSLGLLERVRASKPGYPLIKGGRARGVRP